MLRMYVSSGSGISEALVPSDSTITFGQLPAIMSDISNNVVVNGTTDIYGTVTVTDANNDTVVYSVDSAGNKTVSGTNTERAVTMKVSLDKNEQEAQDKAAAATATVAQGSEPATYSIVCINTGATYDLTDVITQAITVGGRTIVCKKL